MILSSNHSDGNLLNAGYVKLGGALDLGDSWEFLDDPRYPTRFSVMGTEIGVNYVVYAMTH